MSVLLYSCETSAEKTQEKIQKVEVVHPTLHSFTEGSIITGSAEPNQHVMLYAMESGYLRSIKKDIGDYVKKGDVIAVLENPQIRANYNEKLAQLNGSKATFDRLKSIVESTPSLTPIQAVEDAETNYLSLKASVNALEERIGFLTVRAPFSGIVTQRFLDNGALIQSGLTQSNPQALVEIQDIHPIRVSIPLPSKDLASSLQGQEVSISFPELHVDPIKATITRSSGVLDAMSKTMEIQIDVENKDGKIKPGMYAKVQFLDAVSEQAISLPIQTKSSDKKGAFIMLVENDQVKKIDLKPGLSNKEYFEVLNSEVNENSLVIIKGQGLVKDGQSVEPIMK